jgi:hypothetical protein
VATVTGEIRSDSERVGTWRPAAAPNGSFGLMSTAVAPFVPSQETIGLSGMKVIDGSIASNDMGRFRRFVLGVSNQGVSVTHLEGFVANGLLGTRFTTCEAPCPATIRPNATGTGFNLTLTNARFVGLTGDTMGPAVVTYNGSVDVDWPGAFLMPSNMPRATTDSVRINGQAAAVRATFTYPFVGTVTPEANPSIVLQLPNGQSIFYTASEFRGNVFRYFSFGSPNATFGDPVQLDASSITVNPTSYTLRLPAHTFRDATSGQTYALEAATINVSRPAGSLSVTGDQTYPISQAITSAENRELIHQFFTRVAGTETSGAQLKLIFKDNVLVEMDGRPGTTGSLRCINAGRTGAGSTVPVCPSTGYTLSADRKTVTLTNFAAPVAQSNTTIVLNGTLSAYGY